MSRTPEKGKPNFSNLDDGRVHDYKLMVNELMGAFDYDPEIVDALHKAWEALSEECVRRTYQKPYATPKMCGCEGVLRVRRKSFVQRPLIRGKKYKT